MMVHLHFGRGFWRYKLAVVTSWNELDKRQLIQAALLLHSGKSAGEAIQKALQILCKKWTVPFLLLPIDFRERCEKYATWLVDGDNTLTKQLLPKYKKLYGPDDDFNNLLLVEFHYTETAYNRLINGKDPDALDELIAILYREPKENYNHQRNSDGDHRKAFVYGDIAWHKAKVKKWPTKIKLAVMLWYDGCRQQLVKDYPLVYPTKAEPEQDNFFEGLYKLMRTISGEKYGTIDRVELLNVHTAHLELSCMMEDNRQQEAAIKKANHE